jgi:hypothetical protein
VIGIMRLGALRRQTPNSLPAACDTPPFQVSIETQSTRVVKTGSSTSSRRLASQLGDLLQTPLGGYPAPKHMKVPATNWEGSESSNLC